MVTTAASVKQVSKKPCEKCGALPIVVPFRTSAQKKHFEQTGRGLFWPVGWDCAVAVGIKPKNRVDPEAWPIMERA
jgi:hypothetical protein